MPNHYAVGTDPLTGQAGWGGGSMPPINPEPFDPTVWQEFWVWTGRGNTQYSVPVETFYAAYQKSDFNNANSAEITVKLFTKTTLHQSQGGTTVHATVQTFNVSRNTTIGAAEAQKDVFNEAIRRFKLYLINRYADYPFTQTGDWDSALEWATQYVNNQGSNGGGMGMGILALAVVFVAAFAM